MIQQFREDDPDKLRNIWQILCYRMNIHQKTPQRLSELTGYPVIHIKKGIKGEAAPITDVFLQKCVTAFSLASGRGGSGEQVSITLTREECINLLKPPSAMPPTQGNFWEKGNVDWGEG